MQAPPLLSTVFYFSFHFSKTSRFLILGSPACDRSTTNFTRKSRKKIGLVFWAALDQKKLMNLFVRHLFNSLTMLPEATELF